MLFLKISVCFLLSGASLCMASTATVYPPKVVSHIMFVWTECKGILLASISPYYVCVRQSVPPETGNRKQNMMVS
jgi:hypothetical protein